MSDFGLGAFQAASSVLTAPMNFQLSMHSLDQQQKQFEATQQLQKDLAAQYNEMVTDQFNQQLDFQKTENELMRQREDNAVQRRSIDLAKAGINPLLAGSGGASASLGGTSFSTPNLAMPQVSSNYPTHVPRFDNPDLSSAWLSRNYGSQSDLNLQRIVTEKTQAALNEARTEETASRILVNAANAEYVVQQTMTEKERTRFTRWLASTQNVEFERAIVGLGLDKVDLRRADEMSLAELEALRVNITKSKAEAGTMVSREVRGWVTDILDGALDIVDRVMASKGSK